LGSTRPLQLEVPISQREQKVDYDTNPADGIRHARELVCQRHDESNGVADRLGEDDRLACFGFFGVSGKPVQRTIAEECRSKKSQ